ncbi:MAG: MFS transporter [Candidatus Dormibacteria bacterium]
MIGVRRVNPWLVLVIVGLAQFMVVLDATVVNVALPSIQRDLHFSTGSLEWVINAYALTFGGFLLLGGRAGDLFGRRRLFLAGVALFSVASLLNGFAGSAAELVTGRALQGIGGALVSPAALSVLMTTFAEGRQRVRAMGVWSAVAIGGGAVGLVLGGVLTQLASWQWVFFVNVPVGAATLFLAARFVPESRAADATGRVDVAGALTVTAGLIALVYTIVNAQTAGWVSVPTLGLAAVSVALLGTFVLLENRRTHPLIRLGALRMRSLTGANAVMLLVASGMFAVFFFASLYVQDVLGYDPLRAGFAFLPMTAMIVAGAGLSQVLIRRVGVREVAMIGMALAAVGMLLLSRLPVAGSYAGNLLPGILVMSLGMGLTFVPVTLMATTNVDPRDAGLASGLLNTTQQIGGALGLAVLSTLAANTTSSTLAASGSPTAAIREAALLDGFHVAFLVAAVLLVVGVAVLRGLVRRTDVARVEAREEPALAA